MSCLGNLNSKAERKNILKSYSRPVGNVSRVLADFPMYLTITYLSLNCTKSFNSTLSGLEQSRKIPDFILAEKASKKNNL